MISPKEHIWQINLSQILGFHSGNYDDYYSSYFTLKIEGAGFSEDETEPNSTRQ
jgi:hypothetical protein